MSGFRPAEAVEFCGIHLSIFFSGVFITLTCISVAGLRSRIQKSITNVFDRFHSRTKEFGDLGKVGPKEEVHACVDCIYVCCLFQCNSRPFEEQVMHRNFWNSYFTRTPLKRSIVFASLATAWVLFLMGTLFLSFILAVIESIYCTAWKWLVTGFLVSFIYCTIPLIMISFIRLWIIYWDLSWVLGSPMEDFPESEQVYNVHDATTRDFIAHSELPSFAGHKVNREREEERELEKIKTNFLMSSTVRRGGHYKSLEEMRGQRGGDHIRKVRVVPAPTAPRALVDINEVKPDDHPVERTVAPSGSSSTQRPTIHGSARVMFVNEAPLSTRLAVNCEPERHEVQLHVPPHSFTAPRSPTVSHSPTVHRVSTADSGGTVSMGSADFSSTGESTTRVTEITDSASMTPTSALSSYTSMSPHTDQSMTVREIPFPAPETYLPGTITNGTDQSSSNSVRTPQTDELFDIGSPFSGPQHHDIQRIARLVPFGTHIAAVVQNHRNKNGS